MLRLNWHSSLRIPHLLHKLHLKLPFPPLSSQPLCYPCSLYIPLPGTAVYATENGRVDFIVWNFFLGTQAILVGALQAQCLQKLKGSALTVKLVLLRRSMLSTQHAAHTYPALTGPTRQWRLGRVRRSDPVRLCRRARDGWPADCHGGLPARVRH